LLEVSADFPSGSEAYKAAAAEFGQPVRPRQIKIAYRNPANNIIDELNTIYDADPDWYWLSFTHDVRDNAEARAASEGGGSFTMPLDWKVMSTLGVLMLLIVGHIRFALFKRCDKAVQAKDWPAAAAVMDKVRTWVLVNLAIGVFIVGFTLLN